MFLTSADHVVRRALVGGGSFGRRATVMVPLRSSVRAILPDTVAHLPGASWPVCGLISRLEEARMFDIALSKAVRDDDLYAAFRSVVGAHALIDMVHAGGSLRYAPSESWVLVTASTDPEWPMVVACLNLQAPPDVDADLAPLLVCEHLARHCGVDAVSFRWPDTSETAGLAPQDPYWAVALLRGEWFLVSTAGTKLMGPYVSSDGDVEGSEPIRVMSRLSFAAYRTETET